MIRTKKKLYVKLFLFRHSRSLLLYNVSCFVPSAVAKARLGTTFHMGPLSSKINNGIGQDFFDICINI